MFKSTKTTISMGNMLVAVLQALPFPLARWAQIQPATVDPILDLCTRYPLLVHAYFYRSLVMRIDREVSDIVIF